MNERTDSKIIKKLTFVLMVGILTLCICSKLQAEPFECRFRTLEPFPLEQPPPAPIPFVMMRLMDTLEANVIAQLTGDTLSAITQELTVMPVHQILEERGLPPEIFFELMDEQLSRLVKQTVAAKMITKKQGDQILEETKRRSPGFEEEEFIRELFDLDDPDREFRP